MLLKVNKDNKLWIHRYNKNKDKYEPVMLIKLSAIFDDDFDDPCFLKIDVETNSDNYKNEASPIIFFPQGITGYDYHAKAIEKNMSDATRENKEINAT